MEATNSRIKELETQIYQLKEELSQLRRENEGEVVADATFMTADGEVSLSDLFGDKDRLILIHNMGHTCSYCTLWADDANNYFPRIEERAAFALCSPDDPAKQAEVAAHRGWKFRMVSDAGKEFTRAMGYLDDEGYWHPGFSAFAKREDGTIVRLNNTSFGPYDDFCPIWHYWDMIGLEQWSWQPPKCLG
ncbi:MAG: DUF899 family protein [Armatimonadetes bacterium]|nr:DUF899 family protein [Armatimonadota bacterium]